MLSQQFKVKHSTNSLVRYPSTETFWYCICFAHWPNL